MCKNKILTPGNENLTDLGKKISLHIAAARTRCPPPPLYPRPHISSQLEDEQQWHRVGRGRSASRHVASRMHVLTCDEPVTWRRTEGWVGAVETDGISIGKVLVRARHALPWRAPLMKHRQPLARLLITLPQFDIPQSCLFQKKKKKVLHLMQTADLLIKPWAAVIATSTLMWSSLNFHCELLLKSGGVKL